MMPTPLFACALGREVAEPTGARQSGYGKAKASFSMAEQTCTRPSTYLSSLQLVAREKR
jgi:hypothetical protein